MKFRAAIAIIGLSLCLGACADLDVSLFGDDDAPSAEMANGCTAQGCPQAAQYCVARGYHPETEAYHRCLISVEDNLRKGR